jgi:hypothetical protein
VIGPCFVGKDAVTSMIADIEKYVIDFNLLAMSGNALNPTNMFELILTLCKKDSNMWSNDFISAVFSLYSFHLLVHEEDTVEIIESIWNALSISESDTNLLQCLLDCWKDSILDPLHAAESRYSNLVFLSLDLFSGVIRYWT